MTEPHWPLIPLAGLERLAATPYEATTIDRLGRECLIARSLLRGWAKERSFPWQLLTDEQAWYLDVLAQDVDG